MIQAVNQIDGLGRAFLDEFVRFVDVGEVESFA